jgi:hypothetical protein
MIKLKDKIIPITLIFLGVYIWMLPSLFRIELSIIIPLSQTLIIIGFLYLGYKEILKRFSLIEKELEIDKDNKIKGVKLSTGEISNEFLSQIKRKKFNYKASI